jgi:hypothetical protein
MTWKIHYRAIAELPKLMWLAIIEPQRRTVRILHGPAVECRDEWMVEGIWDGEFARGEFHRSEHFFGSGIRVEGDRVYCVPSSALVDRLFYCVRKETTLVSNSLIALLAFTGSKLDSRHDYKAESFTILEGLERYRHEFTVVNPEIDRFYQIFHDTIVIDGQGMTFERRSRVHEISSFAQYYSLLNGVLIGLKANFTSPDRRARLDAFTTLSSGYDSTAVACLASAIGVKTCFVSRRSNSIMPAWVDRHRTSDDGGPIADALAMQAIDLSHRISSSSDDELYFYAVDPARTELVFHTMTAHIERNCQAAVVFTGYHGDKMWDAQLEEHYLNDQIMRGDISGLRLAEIRLKSGFIHAAVPFIFARSVASISKISESPEMDPWRLRNAYDRPIPRRISETAGVGRQLFGVRKKMVSTSHAYPRNAQLRKRFFEHLETDYRLKPARVHASMALDRASHAFLRALSHLGPIRRSQAARDWTHDRLRALERKPILRTGLELQSLLFLWSTDVLAQNTAVILQRTLGSSVLLSARRSAPCGFDRRDVDLFHLHHRVERALRGCLVGISRCFDQHARRDLPRQAPLVLAPPALALGAAVADDGVPVAIGLGLILGDDLEREGLALLERRAAVQAEALHAEHGKFDCEHLPLFAVRKVARRLVDRLYSTVRKSLRVKAGCFFGVAVIPKTNHVLSHRLPPLRRPASGSSLQ